MTKGPRNSQDDVGYYSHIIKVSGTSNESARLHGRCRLGTPGDGKQQRDRLVAAGERAGAGSTYYVTRASTCAATPAPAYTLAGHSITFSSPPPSNKAVFVVYIHGTHSDDGSTLAYQQTATGDGGFNSIYIDDGYTSRYLGKHMAMGIDWLDGYVGLSSTLRQQVMNLLVQWSDYYRDYGYYNNSIQSNYGAGAYVSRMMTAPALEQRHAEGRRLVQEMTDYRQSVVIPQLLGSGASLAGGFWAEGWNYGALSRRKTCC